MSDIPGTPPYRIRKGETILALVWSSIGVALSGFNRIVYEDGTEDDFTFDKFTSAGVRGQEIMPTNRTAKKDGYVVEGIVITDGTATKRGRCYVQVLILRANQPDPGNARQVIYCDYVYDAHAPTLGIHVPPGPAGGHGFLQTYAAANPAAGSDVAAIAVPTNTVWKPLTYTVQLVQGITQTPLPTLRARKAAVTVIWQVPITPTAISASSTAQLSWGRGLVQTSFTAVVGDEFHTAPLPDVLLDETDDLATVTDGIGANTDYGVPALSVEEWVIP